MFLIRFFLFTRFGLLLTVLGVLTGGFYFWLHEHDKNIIDNATSTFNAAQEQIYENKTNEFIQKSETIANDAVNIISDVNKQNDIVTDNLSDVDKKASEANDEKRSSSLYLKSVVKQLNDLYGSKK